MAKLLNNQFTRIANSTLNNNQMASSKVIESGIFFVSTTTQGTGVGESAYTSTNIAVRWTKNVDEVTLVFQSDSVSRSTVVNNNVRYRTIPEQLRPNGQQVFDVILRSNNSTGTYLVIAIRTDGEIVIGVGGTNPSTGNQFTAGSDIVAGPYAFSITYYTGLPLPDSNNFILQLYLI